jgi:hypothetical protein
MKRMPEQQYTVEFKKHAVKHAPAVRIVKAAMIGFRPRRSTSHSTNPEVRCSRQVMHSTLHFGTQVLTLRGAQPQQPNPLRFLEELFAAISFDSIEVARALPQQPQRSVGVANATAHLGLRVGPCPVRAQRLKVVKCLIVEATQLNAAATVRY